MILIPIVGSMHAFFTLNSVSPLLGAACSMSSMSILWGIRMFYRMTLGGFTAGILYHIPTFFGTWYLATVKQSFKQSLMSRLVLVSLLILCIIIFVLDTIGSLAWPYALYWVIPMVCMLIPRPHFFLQALGSTFMTHALGSVIWLIGGKLTAEQWLALIPLVMFERLLCAGMMTLGYYLCMMLYRLVRRVTYTKFFLRYST